MKSSKGTSIERSGAMAPRSRTSAVSLRSSRSIHAGVQRIRDKRAVGRQRRHHAVVPRRRGTRPTGRAVGEGGRRPDECGLTAPTSTPWLFRRRNHSPQAELGDIRTCVTAFSSGVTCSPHRRCSRSWRGCSRSCRCSSSQASRHRPSLRRRERVGATGSCDGAPGSTDPCSTTSRSGGCRLRC